MANGRLHQQMQLTDLYVNLMVSSSLFYLDLVLVILSNVNDGAMSPSYIAAYGSSYQ